MNNKTFLTENIKQGFEDFVGNLRGPTEIY